MTRFGFAAVITAGQERRSHAAPARATGDARGDGGYTLIEILIAVLIMGLVFGTILAGMATAITVTHDNRQRADADRVGRILAEKIKSPDLYVYKPCAVKADFPVLTAPELVDAKAAGWRLEVTKVEYWTDSGTTAADNFTGAGTCTVNTATTPSSDSGIQRITIVAKPPVDSWRSDKVAQPIVVIKRDTRTDCHASVSPVGGTC